MKKSFVSIFNFESLGVTIGLILFSVVISQVGIVLGKKFVAPGDGFPQSSQLAQDLFRFDSFYYLALAEDGYSYSGDPASSPNIVFAPLFPVIVSEVSYWTGVSAVMTGFTLNLLFLFFAILFLYDFLKDETGHLTAVLSLGALLSSAGSYSLHAFYSEATMLVCLSLALLAWQNCWNWILAFAVMGLGASRVAAVPFVLAFSVWILLGAGEERDSVSRFMKQLAQASICWLGIVSYLFYIHIHYGNPFVLLPEIQHASWGLFHQETSWWKAVTGFYILEYLWRALGRGLQSLTDIRSLNLLWLMLGMCSVVYSFFRWKKDFLPWLFAGYFGLIYISGINSDYLISVHRFMLVMLPIYLMFGGLIRWVSERSNVYLGGGLAVLLLLMNLAFGLLHTAKFNQGVWYFF